MKPLDEITGNDIVRLVYTYGSFHSEQAFYDYFNDIRNQYVLEMGLNRAEPFNTSRDQFYKWMKLDKGISKTNLNREMAEYILFDLFLKKDDFDKLGAFIEIISALSFNVDEYRKRFLDHEKTFSESECRKYFSEIVSQITVTAFTPQKKNTSTPKTFLPKVLSSQGYYADVSILHREHLVNTTEEIMLALDSAGEVKKGNIVLYGFGGIGKTSIARVIYGRMLSDIKKGTYSSIGWIDYNGNLRNSILCDDEFSLYENITDEDKRWSAIKKTLLNWENEKVLLFIDNVDNNAEKNQYPQTDLDLQRFADAPNINLIITSRLTNPLREGSFNAIEVPPLEEAQCEELFFKYWQVKEKKECDRIFVNQLIKLAGYHTLTIKLLACGARYRNISSYYNQISNSGFSFHYLQGSKEENAALELRKLFDLKTRTQKQSQVLWDFAVLPQIVLSTEEVEYLLGYQRCDLQPLVEEGWLNYDGGFSLHPLVKTVIRMGMKEGKAPNGTMQMLVSLVTNGHLISENDEFVTAVRKINIVTDVFEMISIPDSSYFDFFKNLGIAEYNYGRKRISSIHRISQALIYADLHPNCVMLNNIADAKYQIGYIKSSAEKYRSDAWIDLQEALEIWETLGDQEMADKARDHLGYVLSDSEDTYAKAEYYLQTALRGRRNRYMKLHSWKLEKDYATTCDNLGALLMKDESRTSEALQLLHEAYRHRKNIYEAIGTNSTEVAWTAFNIAECLSRKPELSLEAYSYYCVALDIRKKQEELYPGVYIASIVYTLVAIGKLIQRTGIKREEIESIIEEAIYLRSQIDEEHADFYLEQVDYDLRMLSARIIRH